MKSIRTLVILAAACMAGLAAAAEPRSFTQQEFDALARAGRPVIVDVAAPWCPTCRAQKPVIEAIAARAEYAHVAVLVVDFDSDKAALRAFRASSQSTLIAFKAGRETGRSIGDTTKDGIEGLFRKAVE